MKNVIANLIADESGFIVSAELVLIATIAILGMVVGLSEVAVNINHELEDVGTAFGSLNQSFCVQGVRGCNGGNGGSYASGSCFRDTIDTCDHNNDIQCTAGIGESGYGYHAW